MTTTTATDNDDWPPRRLLTDREWARIKKSLANVYVNADTVVVELWPDLVTHTADGTAIRRRLEWPLRFGLTLIAEYSDKSPATSLPDDATPLEVAKNQSRAIKRCSDLVAWLDDPLNYNPGGIVRLRSRAALCCRRFPLNNLAGTAQAALSAFVAELERCRDELMAMGASRGQHLRKPHIEFWKELERVWRANIGRDVKWRNKNLADFLFVCSTPFFPKETTDDTVSAFIERPALSSK